MQQINLITRRGFMDQSMKMGLAAALSTLVDIPFVIKSALAAGNNIGANGKKMLFIFLRGANDGLNSIIPAGDKTIYDLVRPNIKVPVNPANFSTLGQCDFPTSGSGATFGYAEALHTGNGFAGLHPSLKFLAPVYNAGDLALIHRVGYPRQSRSHFDSQNYWENGNPNNNLVKDGMLYRTMIESGLANTAPLTGVSVQSALPLILRGSAAAMTNLTDPTRNNLFGIPNDSAGNLKADAALRNAMGGEFSDKKNRELLKLQFENLNNTLSLLDPAMFSDTANTFVDNEATDGDFPYFLFPTTNAKNGGYTRPGGGTDNGKYVVDTGAYGFFSNLKAAAIILNKTDAIVAGTEFGGFDTHQTQGSATGAHANLQRRIGWAMYALRKYFSGSYSDRCAWNNLVVVTLSEFGRTTVENGDMGTDHAEAGPMFVAGGAVKGYGKAGVTTSVYGCGSGDTYNGQNVGWVNGSNYNATAGTGSGTMFGVSSRYLKRCIDYRSVLGKVIRDHLGATQDQLNRIIPGYTVTGERLQSGGVTSGPGTDGTTIAGELPIV
ncbi:MAG: DUF1501 domain-containing protein [Opitutaceae bacterium]|nr:DUF1501 domain-containing protein [Verrucomicrobiales bacterium]